MPWKSVAAVRPLIFPPRTDLNFETNAAVVLSESFIMNLCCSYFHRSRPDVCCCCSVLLLYINMYNTVVYTDDKTVHYVTFSRMNTKSAISPGKSFLSCSRYKQSGRYLRMWVTHLVKICPALFKHAFMNSLYKLCINMCVCVCLFVCITNLNV
jgi:hypothetical protein